MNLPDLEMARKRTNKKVTVFDKFEIEEELKQLGQNKTYYIRTYGCQMNEHDTEKIKAILEEMSFLETGKMEQADLIILNTCAVRENAHNKVFGMIGRIKHLKKTNSKLIVGLCGCMAQEEIVVNEILNKFKWLDLVFGTHNIYDLPNILATSLSKNKVVINVLSKEGNIYENIPIKRESPSKAWVNIMYGCDKFCTYCIVPYTRGKQRSRRPEFIIKEVKKLMEQGYQEVTLLGQNVNAYGKDLDLDYYMEDLLNDVAKTNIKRIRFISNHPWDFTDQMIEVIKKNDNIMPYIHLPLQSGSNKILKLMGRRYTKEKYLELYNKIKETIPNVAITTDIIVGFPSETEEDFNETLDVVNQCQFDSAYTFIFSKRVGTPAAKMVDSVSLEIKRERLQILNTLVNKYSNLANQKYLNKEVLVLVEDINEKDQNKLFGYTETMKRVNFKGNKNIIGKIVKVKINKVKTWSLDGEICI